MFSGMCLTSIIFKLQQFEINSQVRKNLQFECEESIKKKTGSNEIFF